MTGVKPCRRFVEKQDFRIQSHGRANPALFHSSAQLRRIKFLVPGKPDQTELISCNVGYFRVRQLGVGFERRDTFSSKFIELQRAPPEKELQNYEKSLLFPPDLKPKDC